MLQDVTALVFIICSFFSSLFNARLINPKSVDTPVDIIFCLQGDIKYNSFLEEFCKFYKSMKYTVEQSPIRDGDSISLISPTFSYGGIIQSVTIPIKSYLNTKKSWYKVLP